MQLTADDYRFIADLKVQAMLFDLDLDIETLNLVPKKNNQVPIWITRWREKESTSDRQPNDYEGGTDDPTQ